VNRLLYLFALLGLLLSPMHMADAAPAAAPAPAHHAPAHHAMAVAADHCAGDRSAPDRDRAKADCALGCSAMPGACAALAGGPAIPHLPYIAAPVRWRIGAGPVSDPPPPRHA
jgi:hypothetical protein